jgi:hypothetical protein
MSVGCAITTRSTIEPISALKEENTKCYMAEKTLVCIQGRKLGVEWRTKNNFLHNSIDSLSAVQIFLSQLGSNLGGDFCCDLHIPNPLSLTTYIFATHNRWRLETIKA